MEQYQASLHQLAYEFNTICWDYSLHLSSPFIEITESKTVYGMWIPATRTIRISRILIANHSWDTVINVFKHEVAHQICVEYFNDTSTSHKDNFQDACDMLGLTNEFRRPSAELHQSLQADNDGLQGDFNNAFIVRIKKLLALAKSSNEYEARLAMKKAGQAMRKYNINAIDCDGKQRYSYVIINNKKKRIESWQKVICALLSDFFFVSVIGSTLYDATVDQTHKTLELLGRYENVVVAEHCYYFLQRQLAYLWQQNRAGLKGKGQRAKNSYYLGLLQGVRKTLTRQEQEAGYTAPFRGTTRAVTTCSQLVVDRDMYLQSYISDRFPKLQKRRQSKTSILPSVYDSGVKQGEKIVLNLAVTSQTGNRGNLLALSRKGR